MEKFSAIRSATCAQRARVEDLFAQIAECGRTDPGFTRASYSPEETAAHAVMMRCAADLGLAVHRDAAANTYMTLPGRDRSLPPILIGSHLDTVAHGGNYDGAAGVVAGLAAIAAIRSLGLRPARDLTVMGVRAEESVWFQVSYVGSRAALGTLPDGALDAVRIDSGRRLAEHIAREGGDPEALVSGKAALDAGAIHAFLEVHIEQAPSLEEAGIPVGLCTGIPGNVRYPYVRIAGRYDHVGTPRRFRRDAAMAGAEIALALDQVWQAREAAGCPMAVTFGRFHTDAAAHGLTTVPGEFRFSLDMRAYEAEVLSEIEAAFLDAVATVAESRGVTVALGSRAEAGVGMVSARIHDGLTAAAAALGITTRPLGSPASHDAAAFAKAGVPMAMLFVRNANGSHNPNEAMAIDDLLDAVAILASWLVAETCGI
ncbi:allantoate amidohydrolase [Methylobacterium sp. GXF4]|jgi:N-carbamoyl-L-amino-acid hydrolase|uniref:Zn-dependent hydrolase n=1 Tax=Methylobacterium brachiatum TaxID=269660 RepID=A0ABV1R1D3_9HYPH|nr:Zn-dependent hydrolase [Methylobacterium sp. GXF4]EIZ86941.1 allantoate amidohydrolase [Methylobacterium sp. GXF4]MDF2599554.1 allantoate amidohydrolase [Methylobacterium brachiatum]CAA2156387.1 N-carbamoyl-L-amino acid hydrolase [Methylobacterium brachiatum]